MKKTKVERYDLDKVYFFNEYSKTIAYGKTNAHISGVEDLLHNLESEKNHYLRCVADIINPERQKEEIKYQHYDKWRKATKCCIHVEILLMIILIIAQCLPVKIRISLLYTLFELLLGLLTFLIVPLIFIITMVVKYIYGICYNRYKESISNRIKNLGSNFTRISINYYEEIDNLYLLSLEPTHRELILMRRQQEAHNQEMLRLEKERHRAETERYNEQRKAREATEGLLAIEIEREKRRNNR